MSRWLTHHLRWAGALLAVLSTLAATGCLARIPAHLMWVMKGQTVAAECDQLKGKKVAVVCVSRSSGFGPGTAAQRLAFNVENLLAENVKDIEIISQDDIADWVDHHGPDEADYYRDIGRGVAADMVVGIDLEQFSLHEGQTLYRGRADVTTNVYDMSQNGKVIFRRHLPEFTYPQTGGLSSTSVPSKKFANLFLHMLSKQIAQQFYAYDFMDSFGSDTAMNHLQ